MKKILLVLPILFSIILSTAFVGNLKADDLVIVVEDGVAEFGPADLLVCPKGTLPVCEDDGDGVMVCDCKRDLTNDPCPICHGDDPYDD